MTIENFGIIIEDNPISRCYLNIFLKNKIKFDKIIILSKKNFFLNKYNLFKNFYLNNYYAINFLKDKNLLKVIGHIEDYFSYNQGFRNMEFLFQVYKLQDDRGGKDVQNLRQIFVLQLLQNLVLVHS